MKVPHGAVLKAVTLVPLEQIQLSKTAWKNLPLEKKNAMPCKESCIVKAAAHLKFVSPMEDISIDETIVFTAKGAYKQVYLCTDQPLAVKVAAFSTGNAAGILREANDFERWLKAGGLMLRVEFRVGALFPF
jgi:hypothetical protein